MGDNKDSHFWDSLLTFAAGAAAGFIVGILFAPASGKETRKKIKDQAIKTGEKAKVEYEKIAREAEKGLKIAREKTSGDWVTLLAEKPATGKAKTGGWAARKPARDRRPWG